MGKIPHHQLEFSKKLTDFLCRKKVRQELDEMPDNETPGLVRCGSVRECPGNTGRKWWNVHPQIWGDFLMWNICI